MVLTLRIMTWQRFTKIILATFCDRRFRPVVWDRDDRRIYSNVTTQLVAPRTVEKMFCLRKLDGTVDTAKEGFGCKVFG